MTITSLCTIMVIIKSSRNRRINVSEVPASDGDNDSEEDHYTLVVEPKHCAVIRENGEFISL